MSGTRRCPIRSRAKHSTRMRPKPRCVLCGSTENVQANHVGGRHHVAYFTSPLCGEHHDEFHRRLRAAGVNLEFTSDPRERIRRARSATLIFLWMLEEQEKYLNESGEKQL
jgi:hypothetical protein